MILIISAVLIFFGTLFMYYPYKKKLCFMIKTMKYHMQYNTIGLTETIVDMINTFNNWIDLPKKPGKIAIVTGGSRGIGLKIVEMLLECDMEVIMACRNLQAGHEAIKEIRRSGLRTGQVKAYKLDNASFESVRQFAAEMKRDYSKIDVLVNNAGVMFGPQDTTVDGFEKHWGVNHLSHFLLTALLLPLLNAAGSPTEKSRIVNVSSCVHRMDGINFSDPNLKEEYFKTLAYSQSKLAQIMFTNELQQLLKEKMLNINVYSVHPGIVMTDLFDDTFVGNNRWFFQYIFKNSRQGATPIVYAAVDKRVENQGGIYISNCKKASTSSTASDPALCNKLFELSLEQTKLQDFFQYL